MSYRKISQKEADPQGKLVKDEGTLKLVDGNIVQSDIDDKLAASKNLKTRTHQRLVFADPVAFRYLEEDPSTAVLERRGELQGYELYLVEQWACSRTQPTFVITTYTGLPQHKIQVGVLSVSTNEELWSPRLRIYMKAVSQTYAREKETVLGTLMVTNLSSFPSALTVVAVPDGVMRNHREDFFVSENLKRLGCTGRAGLNLSPPTDATQAKFRQMYRTSEQVRSSTAVTELVQLCQVALVMFMKLAAEYADGLLCDVTEVAINDWWTDIGTEYFNFEPADGILGPSTVAALLGLFLGARNRLNAYGAPVSKDAFDLSTMKRGIAYFQKYQKLEKTRRLDRQTLARLHRVTSKAANSEGWAVPRAVKSTVAELSGKGGEMVMGMVGARDKVGIADVEGVDITDFVENLSGNHCKWLWKGKARKAKFSEPVDGKARDEDSFFFGDEPDRHVWPNSANRAKGEDSYRVQPGANLVYANDRHHGSQESLDIQDRDNAPRRNVFKSVTGRIGDAKSGLGRIKDAVGTGLRGHHRTATKDSLYSDATSAPQVSDLHMDSTLEQAFDEQLAADHNSSSRGNDSTSTKGPAANRTDLAQQSCEMSYTVYPTGQALQHAIEQNDEHIPSVPHVSDIGDAKEVACQGAPNLVDREVFALARRSTPDLRQDSQVRTTRPLITRASLSFTLLEDVFVKSYEMPSEVYNGDGNFKVGFGGEVYRSICRQNMTRQLRNLSVHDLDRLMQKVQDVEDLSRRVGHDQESINSLQYRRFEEFGGLSDAAADILHEERSSLSDGLREIEVLAAKLEYELRALQSKVDDVEGGITDYERQIGELETREQTLDNKEVKHQSWRDYIKGILGISMEGN